MNPRLHRSISRDPHRCHTCGRETPPGERLVREDFTDAREEGRLPLYFCDRRECSPTGALPPPPPAPPPEPPEGTFQRQLTPWTLPRSGPGARQERPGQRFPVGDGPGDGSPPEKFRFPLNRG